MLLSEQITRSFGISLEGMNQYLYFFYMEILTMERQHQRIVTLSCACLTSTAMPKFLQICYKCLLLVWGFVILKIFQNERSVNCLGSKTEFFHNLIYKYLNYRLKVNGLSFSQIVGFFDHQYHWEETTSVLEFLHRDSYQGKILRLTLQFNQTYSIKYHHGQGSGISGILF